MFMAFVPAFVSKQFVIQWQVALSEVTQSRLFVCVRITMYVDLPTSLSESATLMTSMWTTPKAVPGTVIRRVHFRSTLLFADPNRLSKVLISTTGKVYPLKIEEGVICFVVFWTYKTYHRFHRWILNLSLILYNLVVLVVCFKICTPGVSIVLVAPPGWVPGKGSQLVFVWEFEYGNVIMILCLWHLCLNGLSFSDK